MADIHPGKVVSVKKEDGEYVYRIKFRDKNLIPPEMDFREKFVSFEHQHEVICPICKSRWKVVKFNMHVWKDCEKCGKTSEQLIKEHEEGPPPIPEDQSIDDILKEFEKMLEEEDDDDDFGFFSPGGI